MERKAYFYVDDVIWVFRDLTRQRPKSMFDQHFLKVLKEAHDKYGMKVMLNCFYRTDYFYGDDEFTLAEMTDAYKPEWEAASDWLKIAFHAKQEFPDYPHINISYEDMKSSYMKFKNEVVRFAGEKTCSKTFNPHWSPVSKAGCQALKDCGIIMSNATDGERREYNGDPNSLPYGHAARLLNNRQPETMVFSRGGRDVAINNSLCAYNHVTKEESKRIKFTTEYLYNDEIGMYFKQYYNGLCANLTPMAELDDEIEKFVGKEYIGAATHEQYSYPDYFNYQSDHNEKILKIAKAIHENGYEFIFHEDVVK